MSVQTIEAMAKWVETNIRENPSLRDMASYVGYSHFYCSAKFKEYMGMTYKQFLAECRIRASLNDLCATHDKITDIAFRYGFASSEAFSRAFSRTFGCSPRQFRKSQIGIHDVSVS